MKFDALDILVIAGLGLTGLGLWLAGYPIALAAVGLVLVVACGVAPYIRSKNDRKREAEGHS